MLSYIPSRWPRAFTVLGVGFITCLGMLNAVLESAIAGGLRDLTGAVEDLPTINLFDAFDRLIGSESSGVQLLFGFGGLFIAYVTGEFILVAMRQVLLLGGRRRNKWNRRTARVAATESPSIQASYDRHRNSVEVLLAICGVLVMFAFLNTIRALEDADYLRALTSLPLALPFVFAFILVIKNIGNDIDDELEFFEEFRK